MLKQLTTIHFPSKHYAVLGGHQEIAIQTDEFKTEWELKNHLIKKYKIDLSDYTGKGYQIANMQNTCRTIWTIDK